MDPTEEQKKVIFETDQWVQQQTFNRPRALSFMTRIISKLTGGKIQDESQASPVLLILAIIIFAVSFYFFSQTLGGPSTPPVGPAIPAGPGRGGAPDSTVSDF